MHTKCIADVVGPWVETDWESGLVERCREAWSTPIDSLSNEMLATFLRQDIATEWVMEEACRRIKDAVDDDSEMYEEELASAVQTARERLARKSTE